MRTDLHIAPTATGVPDVSCITMDSHTDDYYGGITLPFNMIIYSISSPKVYVSTNGVSNSYF